MAVAITQQPTTPNAAYTRLVYVVSGSITTSNPQYQYVMDVYESGSSDLISRITQTKNPAGVAVFDPSRILQGQIEQDDNWKISGSIEPINAVKTFDIKFGEQYGTSPSSSITVYPDLDTTSIEIFPGVIDPNNGSSFNFNTSSFDGESLILTNSPSNFKDSTVVTNQENVVFFDAEDYATITYLSDADAEILVNLSSVDNSGDITFITSSKISPVGDFGTVGIGPKNLIEQFPDFGTYITGSSPYRLRVGTSLDGPGTFVYELNKGQICKDDSTHFAFINSYGFWDYYNVYNPVKRQSNIQRQSVTLPQVDYSSISSPYNVNKRGQRDYYTDVKDRFEVQTDYINKDTANWLEELLQSPSVYVQRGSCFIPIIVTNSTYISNTNQSRQKTFQYTINFEPSNQPYGDWDIIPIACGGASVPIPVPVPQPVPVPVPAPVVPQPIPVPVAPVPIPVPQPVPVPVVPQPVPAPVVPVPAPIVPVPIVPVPAPIVPDEFWALFNCTTQTSGWRSQQTTTELPGLFSPQRVVGSGPTYYYVEGVTTTGTNAGLISEVPGELSCPVVPIPVPTISYTYYFAEPCDGGPTIYMRSSTTWTPGEAFKLSGDDTCYVVGASGAPVNTNDPVEGYPDCEACQPPVPQPVPQPVPVPVITTTEYATDVAETAGWPTGIDACGNILGIPIYSDEALLVDAVQVGKYWYDSASGGSGYNGDFKWYGVGTTSDLDSQYAILLSTGGIVQQVYDCSTPTPVPQPQPVPAPVANSSYETTDCTTGTPGNRVPYDAGYTPGTTSVELAAGCFLIGFPSALSAEEIPSNVFASCALCDTPTPVPVPQPVAPVPQPVPQPVAPVPQPVPQPVAPCLLYTSPSPRDGLLSRMPSSA